MTEKEHKTKRFAKVLALASAVVVAFCMLIQLLHYWFPTVRNIKMESVLHPANKLEWQGFVLVAVGSVFLAIYQVLSRKYLDPNGKVKMSPIFMGMVNYLGGGVILLCASFVFNPPNIWSWFDPNIGLLWPLAATSFLNIIVMYAPLLASAHQAGEVSLTSPIAFFGPLLGVAPAWVFAHEAPNTYGWWGLILMATGIYVFSFIERGKIKEDDLPKALLNAHGKAKFFSPVYMLLKSRPVQLSFVGTLCGAISANFDKKSAVLSSYLFAPAVILIFIGLIGLARIITTDDWKTVKKSHWIGLAFSTAMLFVALCFYWFALYYGIAIYVSALKRIAPILASVFGFFFLKEEGFKKRWVGIVIMAVSATLFCL